MCKNNDGNMATNLLCVFMGVYLIKPTVFYASRGLRSEPIATDDSQ